MSGTTMSLEEYQRMYLQPGQKPRVKGKTKARGQDKAHLFSDAWRLLAPPGSPRLMPEYRFDPTRKFRADFKISRHKLLVEVDGGTYRANGGRHNTDADRLKNNRAVALGYRVMHFSPQALAKDPKGCIELVLMAIGKQVKI